MEKLFLNLGDKWKWKQNQKQQPKNNLALCSVMSSNLSFSFFICNIRKMNLMGFSGGTL